METEEAIRTLYFLAGNMGANLFRDAYFRQATNYDKQPKDDQDGYFNQIIASFLVMVKMLLQDFEKIQIDSANIRLVEVGLYTGFIDYLKSHELAREGQKIWLKFLEAKERNVKIEIADYKKDALKDDKKTYDRVLDAPEKMILLGSVFENLHYFCTKGRALPRDQKFHNFILQKHNEVFRALKKLLA